MQNITILAYSKHASVAIYIYSFSQAFNNEIHVLFIMSVTIVQLFDPLEKHEISYLLF